MLGSALGQEVVANCGPPQKEAVPALAEGGDDALLASDAYFYLLDALGQAHLDAASVAKGEPAGTVKFVPADPITGAAIPEEKRFFTSIPEAMWWCIVTLTTTGYGDLYPVTMGGRLIAAVTMLLGLVLFGMLMNIVGKTLMVMLFGEPVGHEKDDEHKTPEEKVKAALEALLPLQRKDFIRILEAMDGLPVTIRLIDPPLHEFLPDLTELAVRVALAEARGEDVEADLRLLQAVNRLHEQNPMLGLRGVRLGLVHRQQVHAVSSSRSHSQARAASVSTGIAGRLASTRRP